MRRFILITILAITYCFPFQAQNINVDKETLAAMEIAFQTNSLIESQHNQNLLKIRQSYKGAEVAAAGIYFVGAVKLLKQQHPEKLVREGHF